MRTGFGARRARGAPARALALLGALALALLAAALAPSPAAAQGPGADMPRLAAPAPREVAAAEEAAEPGLPPPPIGPVERLSRADSAAALEADQAEFDKLLDRWEEVARRAETAIGEGSASTPAYEVLRETLARHRDQAAELAQKAASAVEPLRAQLEALGPAPVESEEGPVRPEQGEASGVAGERAALTSRIEALELRQRKAELARTRADTLVQEIDKLIRRRFVDQLVTLGPTPLAPSVWQGAAAETLRIGGELLAEVDARAADPVGMRDRLTRLPLLLGALSLGVLALLWGRRKAIRMIHDRLTDESATRGRRVGLGTMASVTRLALPALAVILIRLALRESGLAGPMTSTLLNYMTGGALLYIAARAIGLAFYAPEASLLRLSRLDDEAAAMAANRARGLGLALLLHLTFVEAGEVADLSSATLAAFNLVIISIGAVSLWALARVVAPSTPVSSPEPGEGEPDEDGPQAVEGLGRMLAGLGALVMRAAAVLSVALAAAGYYAASQFVFYPLVMSLGVICTGVLIFTLLREGVEAHLEGRAGDPGGLRLLPVLVGFVIICLSLPVLALIWGARAADLREAWRIIVDGVAVGGVQISPAAFLTFIIVFGVGYGLTRLLQTVMSGSVLPNTRLDAGGRSAITTGLGYTGFVVAALAGIGAAGIDLSSLAIVAGALSVGIGFGLQNIVNNFVSGIILLVERPIKVGDWILVGGDHGTVKRVSVRATQIETFDKSTLFLPNSDLISGKVVNYTHQNNAGRLIIRAPVAYGSDPREVERILTEIARGEDRILRYPAPLIMFAGFGDNGMLFELRVILRDVNLIFNIQSDLYFEVERRLREAGIEIPMAQRALHIRDPQALGQALQGGGYGGGGAAPPASSERGGPRSPSSAPSGAPRPPAGPADSEIAPGEAGDPE